MNSGRKLVRYAANNQWKGMVCWLDSAIVRKIESMTTAEILEAIDYQCPHDAAKEYSRQIEAVDSAGGDPPDEKNPEGRR